MYSWGVLHHTGDMWRALRSVDRLVGPGGRLFIAIYNDQRWASRYWILVKRVFNRLPVGLRVPYAVAVMAPRELASLALHTLRGLHQDYLYSWTRYKATRSRADGTTCSTGLAATRSKSPSPRRSFELYHDQGFELERLRTCGGGLGCNEFVFGRIPPAVEPLSADEDQGAAVWAMGSVRATSCPREGPGTAQRISSQ